MITFAGIEQDPRQEDSREPGSGTDLMLMEAAAVDLSANVQQLGMYLAQMGQMISRMQQRMDELEAQQQRVSITHQQALDLGALIRMRARYLCEKYALTDPADERAVKNAIKREMLQKMNIKDFHDLPAVALLTVRKNVDRWVNIRLIMQRRQLHQETGP